MPQLNDMSGIVVVYAIYSNHCSFEGETQEFLKLLKVDQV